MNREAGRELLLLLPVAGCYAFIAQRNPELAPQLPLFLGFFAAFVALPALGFGGLLVRLPLSLTERLALGAPVALLSLFSLAYAGAALNIPLLVWAQPGLGLAAVLGSIALARRSGKSACPALPWPDLLLTLAVLTAALALCLPKMASVSAPVPGLAIDFYNDDVSTAGYVFSALRALEHGLPVQQFMLAGEPLSYHLLYHFCYAACALVTGLHPLDQVIFLWPPLLWLCLAGAVVVGCRRLAGFDRLETALFALLLLFSAGYGFNATSGVQLFDYQHTYFLGLPALVLFLTAVFGYLSGRRGVFTTHAALCFVVAAGTKANLLALLPVSLLPVLVVRLVRRQGRREARRGDFLLAAQCLAGAAFLKVTLFSSTAHATLHNPSLGKILLGSLNTLWDMGIVVGPFLVLALLAAEASQPLRHKLSRQRRFHLFAWTFILVSAVLLKTFNFIGGDFYFYWQARAIAALAFAPVAAHLFTWRPRKLALATALVLVLGLWSTWDNLFCTVPVKGVPQDASLKVLDADERAGLRWAAEHLDRRKVFFTNKSFYLGSYLGGYIPLELYDYPGFSGLLGHAWPRPGASDEALRVAAGRVARQKVFLDAASPDAGEAALKSLDADYYFRCLRLTSSGAVIPDCLREVHRTPTLVIYENTCRAAQ